MNKLSLQNFAEYFPANAHPSCVRAMYDALGCREQERPEASLRVGQLIDAHIDSSRRLGYSLDGVDCADTIRIVLEVDFEHVVLRRFDGLGLDFLHASNVPTLN